MTMRWEPGMFTAAGQQVISVPPRGLVVYDPEVGRVVPLARRPAPDLHHTTVVALLLRQARALAPDGRIQEPKWYGRPVPVDPWTVELDHWRIIGDVKSFYRADSPGAALMLLIDALGALNGR